MLSPSVDVVLGTFLLKTEPKCASLLETSVSSRCCLHSNEHSNDQMGNQQVLGNGQDPLKERGAWMPMQERLRWVRSECFCLSESFWGALKFFYWLCWHKFYHGLTFLYSASRTNFWFLVVENLRHFNVLVSGAEKYVFNCRSRYTLTLQNMESHERLKSGFMVKDISLNLYRMSFVLFLYFPQTNSIFCSATSIVPWANDKPCDNGGENGGWGSAIRLVQFRWGSHMLLYLYLNLFCVYICIRPSGWYSQCV